MTTVSVIRSLTIVEGEKMKKARGSRIFSAIPVNRARDRVLQEPVRDLVELLALIASKHIQPAKKPKK